MFFSYENYDALLNMNFEIGYFYFCPCLLNMQRSRMDLYFPKENVIHDHGLGL